jgi:hypothetical protein
MLAWLLLAAVVGWGAAGQGDSLARTVLQVGDGSLDAFARVKDDPVFIVQSAKLEVTASKSHLSTNRGLAFRPGLFSLIAGVSLSPGSSVAAEDVAKAERTIARMLRRTGAPKPLVRFALGHARMGKDVYVASSEAENGCVTSRVYIEQSRRPDDDDESNSNGGPNIGWSVPVPCNRSGTLDCAVRIHAKGVAFKFPMNCPGPIEVDAYVTAPTWVMRSLLTRYRVSEPAEWVWEQVPAWFAPFDRERPQSLVGAQTLVDCLPEVRKMRPHTRPCRWWDIPDLSVGALLRSLKRSMPKTGSTSWLSSVGAFLNEIHWDTLAMGVTPSKGAAVSSVFRGRLTHRGWNTTLATNHPLDQVDSAIQHKEAECVAHGRFCLGLVQIPPPTHAPALGAVCEATPRFHLDSGWHPAVVECPVNSLDLHPRGYAVNVRNATEHLSSIAQAAGASESVVRELEQFLLEWGSDTVPHIQFGSTTKSRFFTTYLQGPGTRLRALRALAEAKRGGSFGEVDGRVFLDVQDMVISNA